MTTTTTFETIDLNKLDTITGGSRETAARQDSECAPGGYGGVYVPNTDDPNWYQGTAW